MANLTITPGSVATDSVGQLAFIVAKLTVTGSYPGTNGDIFDPSVLFSQYKCAPKQPLLVDVRGTADYSFDFIPGATLGAGKLKVMLYSTGAEHATAAYNAAITGDPNITIFIVARKA